MSFQPTVPDRLAAGSPSSDFAASVLNVSAAALQRYEEPVSLHVRGKAPRLWRDEGGSISLSVTPRDRLAPSYASLPRRQLEVDIGAFPALEEDFEIALPPGYEVRSLPPSTRGSSPFGSYAIDARQEGGKVFVSNRLALAVSRVKPEQYAEFRKFCQAADAAFEPRLVLGVRGR